MSETKVLHLKFKAANGKTSSISISNPRPDISLANATSVAQTIIDNQVFEGADKSLLTVFENAEVVTTQVNPLQ